MREAVPLRRSKFDLEGLDQEQAGDIHETGSQPKGIWRQLLPPMISRDAGQSRGRAASADFHRGPHQYR
jgi:hypothetical protein